MSEAILLENARLLFGEEEPLSSVAIEGGKVRAVGPAATKEFSRARTIDLEGRWLLPAFADSHLHLHTMAQQKSVLRLERSVDPGGLTEALAAAEARGMRFSSDRWLVAQGWQDPLADRLSPTPREFLDRVSPAPIWAFAVDHHRALLNSAALRLCGLTADRHSGILLEDAMMAAWRHVPELPADLDGAVDDLHGFGVTAVTSFDGTDARETWRHAILTEGKALRVRHSMPHEEFLARVDAETLPPVERDREARFSVPWVKGFLDGTLGSRTAWLLADYDDAPGSRGDERVSAPDRHKLATTIAGTDYALSLHAIGDAAVAAAIEMIDQARCERERLGRAPSAIDRIEHTQLLDRDSLGRLKESGAIASLQPCHLLEDAAIGPERFGARSENLFAVRTLLEAEIPVIFGSDAPIETADPWVDIRAAVDRVDRAGRFPEGWIPTERISIEEAIHGRTVGCAVGNQLPDQWGSIAPGSPADLQVLECDDLEEVNSVGEAQLVELFFAGAPVRGGLS